MRLQEQPYRLLLVLLENPGKVISREELRNRLWPSGTFVDFDGSLRVAVRKLREALDDNAGDPRYIETIPKRGYRFFASEVRRIDSAHEATEQSGDALGADLEPLQTDAESGGHQPKEQASVTVRARCRRAHSYRCRCLPLAPSQSSQTPHRQRCAGPRRLHQHHRRSSLRWHTPSRAGCPTGTITIPAHHL